MSTGLLLVSIPECEFSTWPKDRSLKLLAQDARALRRRAIKGVGVEVQRGLFVQVARRIDDLGVERPKQEKSVFSPKAAAAWIALDALLVPELRRRLERTAPPLAAVPAKVSLLSRVVGFFRKKKQQEAPATPKVLELVRGEQLLFPGDEVQAWIDALAKLDPIKLCAIDQDWKALGEEEATRLLSSLSAVLQRAAQSRAAVLQLLIDTGDIEKGVPHAS